jgi:hypothetical protein
MDSRPRSPSLVALYRVLMGAYHYCCRMKEMRQKRPREWSSLDSGLKRGNAMPGWCRSLPAVLLISSLVLDHQSLTVLASLVLRRFVSQVYLCSLHLMRLVVLTGSETTPGPAVGLAQVFHETSVHDGLHQDGPALRTRSSRSGFGCE